MRQAILMKRIFALALALTAPVAAAQEGQGDVVYVPTPQVVVDEMLRMAKVGPEDYLIDLGSGDGRIIITAATKLGARGFGVDLDTYLLKVANENARKAGVADRAQFFERNLFETDLTKATVITSYLLPELNEKLRPKLLALKPGTRVVTHDYSMGDWDADGEKTLLVPEKTVGDPGKSYIFLYIVPARVAGEWESTVTVGGRPVTYRFGLEQQFQLVHGTVKVNGRDVRLRQFRLAGDRIAFSLSPPVGGKPLPHRFSGEVRDDNIEGTVTIGSGPGQRAVPWRARLVRRGEMRMGAGEAMLAGGDR